MPEVKLTDDEITELEPWNRVRGYRDTADAAAIKVAKACVTLLQDLQSLGVERFQDKYGIPAWACTSDVGVLKWWLHKQGIEVTE